MTESSKPASTAEPAADRLTSQISRLDRVLAFLVLLLALVLASFVVRHSDYWLHLATGRALSDGKYTFGVDPFAYTTDNVYWVNHSWLYDWLFYHLTMLARGPEIAGGIVAVGLKALAMAFLAAILLRIRRPGRGWYAPAVCVGLAVLAMAPRMTLQPVAVSLFFLGLTLFFLVRDGKPEPGNVKGYRVLFTSSPRRLYVLPVLFALWANLDGWFILGPMTLGLYLLGEKLQQALSPDLTGPDAELPGEQRALGMSLAVGLAACLLNPHHVRVFSQLPVELFAAGRFWELREDPRFAVLFVSPFTSAYFTPGFGLNVCGMAYFPLLLGSAISFWLTRSNWRIWRLLVWTAFAALSVTSMLLVPLFAVVAGPIMALNFQDFAARRQGGLPPPARRFLKLAQATRLMTLLLAVILLAGAWPGWLQSHPDNPVLARRVGWGVEIDPSLRQAAYKIELWRLQGWLQPDDHGFNFLPEAAHYFAWFCPDEKGFLDSRYGLFTSVAASYVDVRHMLGGGGRHAPGAVPDWRQIFRRHGITHVVLTATTGNRTDGIVARLLRDPQWTLLYLDGRTSIFGWNDPQKKTADGFARLRLNLAPEAFGPQQTHAPGHGPDRSPEPRTWLANYLSVPEPPPLDSETAGMYVVYFDLGNDDRRFPTSAAMGMVGAGNPTAGVLLSGAATIGTGYLTGFVQDVGPPGALPLAVRAARRAIAANPDVADAYLTLARATGKLWVSQENHWTHTRLPQGLPAGQLATLVREKKLTESHLSPWQVRSLSFRHVMRRVQELTALNQYLAAKPDNPRVHYDLFRIYWSMNYYDVALDHLRTSVAQAKNSPELQKGMTEAVGLLADCEKQVKELQREYELAAASKPALVQAAWAFRPFGLPKQALAALMREDLKTLNPEEASLVIYLHLTLGQAEKLRGQFTDKQKEMLGPVSFELYRVLQAAALGDYAEADSHLALAMEAMPKPGGVLLLHMLQGMTFGQFQPYLLPRHLLAPYLLDQRVTAARQTLLTMQEMDELRVVRGMLALEVGDVENAGRYFREAVSGTEPRYHFEARGIATRYLNLLPAAKAP